MPPRKLTRKFPNYRVWPVFGKQWHISHSSPIIFPLLVNVIRAPGGPPDSWPQSDGQKLPRDNQIKFNLHFDQLQDDFGTNFDPVVKP
mgnify:FL=1